jgi:hypothetical protein
MTDEPRIEIASCPMLGCGSECVAEALMGAVIRVRCLKCGYGLDGFLSVAVAIAAHNALCADVRRGRDAAKIEQERDALRASLLVLYDNDRIERLQYDMIKFEVYRARQIFDEAFPEVRAALDAGQGENGSD